MPLATTLDALKAGVVPFGLLDSPDKIRLSKFAVISYSQTEGHFHKLLHGWHFSFSGKRPW
jgi:hypothetical protein